MTYTPRGKVGYYYDPDVGNFYYAQGHPMKPHRIRMTHNLLLSYGILESMDILSANRASERDMTRFHSDEYINFLKIITPETAPDHHTMLSRFNVLEDCPVFDGLWQYCQIAAGASISGAQRLNNGESSVAINWSGGLHHAKKAEASGFCYINDCVLAILELLTVHPRVLYVDIDIHHGDGVEEAFYTTDRVMTASFHKFGDYFPGTGHVHDVGIGRGKHYSANFPLRDGINDESYRSIFVPVMTKIMQWYQPGAVVLQCGADSLTGDRLGCFNLSLKGHAQCVEFFKNYDVPLLMLGGGGYTIRNVARCWAYETSCVVGEPISDKLPFNDNFEFYGPEFRLHIVPSNMENHNSPEELHDTTRKIMENLRNLPHAPSAPFMDGPRRPREEEEEDDPDVRPKSQRARYVVEYEDSSDEEDDQYISSLRSANRRAKRMKFPRRRFPSTGSRASVDRNRPRGIYSQMDIANGSHTLRAPAGSATAMVRENGAIGGAHGDRAGTDAPNGRNADDRDREGNSDDVDDRRDESGRGRTEVNSNLQERKEVRKQDHEMQNVNTDVPQSEQTNGQGDGKAGTDDQEGLETRGGNEESADVQDDNTTQEASDNGEATESASKPSQPAQPPAPPTITPLPVVVEPASAPAPPAGSGAPDLECDEGGAAEGGDDG